MFTSIATFGTIIVTIISGMLNSLTSNNLDYIVKNGKYITYNLVGDWQVKELADGDGLEYAVGQPGITSFYEGLTGLEIISPEGETILTLSGQAGIGTRPECETIYKFSDTDQSYINRKMEESISMFPNPNITVLEKEDSKEVRLLGKKARIVENKLYWDTSRYQDLNLEGFNPECGGFAFSLEFPRLDFNYTTENNSNPTSSKWYSASADLDSLNERELNELVNILSEIRIK